MSKDPDDHRVLSNFSEWKEVADHINRRGWLIEGDTAFFGKDFIRRNERAIKVRLRKGGYSGPSLKYVEENVNGNNGFAIFCAAQTDEKAMRQVLRAHLNRQF